MSPIVSGWEIKKISELSENVFAGATPNTKIREYWENGNIPWMSSGEINNEIIQKTTGFITKEGFKNSSTKMVPINSVLIALAGQGKTRGKVAVNKIELCTNQSLAAIIPNKRLYYTYLFYSLQYRYLELRELSSGDGGRGGLNLKLINSIKIDLPPLPEQKKIAEILSTWDEAIDSNTRLLHFVKQQKGIYVNRIFMGRLFTNIDSKKAFEKLSKHIVEKTDRNKSDNSSDVLSVSNTKGFILQSDQFEREIASKDKNNYKIVRKGQFAYNPSRVNVGSIDQLLDRDIGIISPMYVVFECKETIESRYLYHFLKSEYFLRLIPRFTQGSVRDSLSFDGLSNMKIHVPSIDKQAKYSFLLDTIDEKINVIERKNEYLKTQKQGLMQRLLTGKVRVKLD